MMRIDDLDSVRSPKPQLPIAGLCHHWPITAGLPDGSNSVGGVKQSCLNPPLRITHPRIQFGARYARHTAGHIQPYQVIVIFGRPMDLVTGKAVLAVECLNVTVLDAAQSAFGR